MKDTIVIAIWDTDDAVFTKHIVVNNHTEVFKYKGRKPNKMIIPESMKDPKAQKKVKSLAAYNCKIITAIGK